MPATLKTMPGAAPATIQTVGSTEIAEILKELVVELSKPGHDEQPKNLQWCYGTSIKNRRERTYGDTDWAGNARDAVVLEIKTLHLAQRIYQGTMRLSTDEEIRTWKSAQEAAKEKINRMEITRKRNETVV